MEIERKFAIEEDLSKELPLCECGCGKIVTKLKNRYINGHTQRGRKHPYMKGKTHPMYGQKHKETSKILIGNAQKDKPATKTAKKNMSIAHIGMKTTKKTKEKMSIAQLGKKKTKATKEKIRIAHTGLNHSKATKRKMRFSAIKRWKRERSVRNGSDK